MLNAIEAEAAFITAINADISVHANPEVLSAKLGSIVDQFNLYLIVTHTPGLLVKDAQNLVKWAWAGNEDAGYDVVEDHYIRLAKEAGKS